MALPFTAADLNAFRAYVKVQKSGRFNMLDPRAASAAGLSRDQMVFVMSNYNELQTAHREYTETFPDSMEKP
jgi:hypothetical protein